MLTSVRRPENPESKQKSRTASPLQSCGYKTVKVLPGCVEGGKFFLGVTFSENGSGQKLEKGEVLDCQLVRARGSDARD